MLYLLGFLISIFVIAYGNAMLKVVARRQEAFDSGKRQQPPTNSYRRTGQALFVIGSIVTVILIGFFVLGEPFPVLG